MAKRLALTDKSGEVREIEAEDFASSISASALPAPLQAKIAGVRRRGPQKEPVKERITIRVSAGVLEEFRATGPGWQARIDAALRDWLRGHSAVDAHG
jgi:uncharacterized protein (DUF4415 family)